MNIHEEQFVNSFIVQEKQAHYLELLDSKRGRKKIITGLDHYKDLDMRFAHHVTANQQIAELIERLLI